MKLAALSSLFVLFGTCIGSSTRPAGSPPRVLAVSPPAATVGIGARLRFTAAMDGAAADVVWAVDEPGGGIIDAGGTYVPPRTEGVYHVSATLRDDRQVSGRATVSVSNLRTVPPPAPGATLYVAPTGDDNNPGTLAAPWRTIQTAMDTASPGSTVNILAGTYHERLRMHVSGDAKNGFITFQNNGFAVQPTGAAGDRVIVDGAGANPEGDTLLDLSDASFVRVQGLELTGLAMPFNGKAVFVGGQASQIELLNNRIHHIVATGDYAAQSSIYPVLVAGAGVTGILIAGNEIFDCQTGWSEALTIVGATGFMVAANWLHDLDAIAIDVGSSDSGPAASYGTLRANRLERLGPASQFGLMPGEGVEPKVGQAIYVQGAHHVIVERNIVSAATYGINVSAETGFQPNDTVFVRDNDVSAVSPEAGAITVGEWQGEDNTTSNVQVLNNTLHGNAIALQVLRVSSLVVKNNVFDSNGDNLVNSYGQPFLLDYNLFAGGGVPPGDAHGLMVAPGFAQDVLIDAGDPAFQPGPSWDNIPETDLVGHARVLGGRVDLGAIEVR